VGRRFGAVAELPLGVARAGIGLLFFASKRRPEGQRQGEALAPHAALGVSPAPFGVP